MILANMINLPTRPGDEYSTIRKGRILVLKKQ